MHVEKLKLYLDLYESKNFTKTARQNFISQAALSQYISSLEEQYGTSFFDRNYSPIHSTKTGDVFYREAQIMYKQYLNMNAAIENSKTSDYMPFRIGYCTLVDLKTILPLLPLLHEAIPDLKVVPIKVPINEVEEYLEKNLCDVAISYESEFHSKNINKIVYAKGDYNVVVSTTHPLASKKEVSAQEAYKYPIVILSINRIGEIHDYMLNRLHNEGIEPIVGREVDDEQSGLFYIISENLVGFVNENTDLSNYEGYVKKIPITNDIHQYNICVSYSKTNSHPVIDTFLKLVKEKKQSGFQEI